MVKGQGSRVKGQGSRVEGVRICGQGSRVSGLGSRGQGLGFRVLKLEYRVLKLGSGVKGFEAKVSMVSCQVLGPRLAVTYGPMPCEAACCQCQRLQAKLRLTVSEHSMERSTVTVGPRLVEPDGA
eukprot:2534524-Rhodomonas_salina.1